jgi:3-deoxy-D-manno-octulosonic-acid transferase
MVVLMELEVWPNFIRACRQRGIPILLINGRLTTSSFQRYKLAKFLVAPTFRRLNQVCAQDLTYAQRFIALGVPPDRVTVTGTMKFDTAQIIDRIPGQEELAAAVGLYPGIDRIWVCGSTGPGEETLILNEYRSLLKRFPNLRLVLVPRKPERFDEVAQIISAAGFPVVRRSNPQIPPRGNVPPVVLGDTMGELRKFYAIAEVVLVGRTLVDLGPRQHGSDMIEPAALGKPVIVGPFTGNFAEVMNQFRLDDAMMVVKDALMMGQAVALLLDAPDKALAMGRRAREVVGKGQGATARHADLILKTLDTAR